MQIEVSIEEMMDIVTEEEKSYRINQIVFLINQKFRLPVPIKYSDVYTRTGSRFRGVNPAFKKGNKYFWFDAENPDEILCTRDVIIHKKSCISDKFEGYDLTDVYPSHRVLQMQKRV